ncbi:MAG: carbamoyl-phosphate synthase (glutamine-hydrolyzing) small subunit, partial [Candidatus Aenigmatarchaeota archaeon]
HATSEKTLDLWLKENGIPGISGIDTRALTKRLRIKGVMLGTLQTYEKKTDLDLLKEEAKNIPDPNERDLVSEVTTKEIKTYNKKGDKTIVLIDCGVKENIIRCLVKRNVKVVRVPADTDFKKIMSFSPSGVLISNGPGDPKKSEKATRVVKKLMDGEMPVFGICLGNQILSLAAGGDTYKLKFGHRSQNQPCIEEKTGRCYITSQNHGFAVAPESLSKEWKPWFTNANDRTNEGIMHRSKPWISVQFHPEASPGPVDTEFIFDVFLGVTK